MRAFKRISDQARFELWRLRDSLRDRLQGRGHRQRVFAGIYSQNLWGHAESVSGAGSSLTATERARRELPAIWQQYQVRSLLDAPCGDFHWMQTIAHQLDRYVGVDIVPELIARNAAAYANEKVSFLCADIAADPLPRADLILCRDCFIHLPTRLIVGALRNFRASGARYLLLTSDRTTQKYQDIPIGSYRPINFTRPPFSIPAPERLVNEDESGSRQLGLWDLQALPL